ncbi:bifunctional nuclease family protein [Chitinispirillales bacterium ANBcel5]|uniref:bifunctional nuclease family protein n=1 Tax=Cellulosispirillum alkaliphilum TaxID=3039283 RepID=UPI002A54CBDC|nr:bifunctional nuclease family protein [Chitinispirillales bacterium ANBcel5]
MILVEVANTFLVNMGKEFVILLKGSSDSRTLPISIGQLEAQSIAIQLNQVSFPRPLTHDLTKNILEKTGSKLIKTEICDLVDETFYAKLIIENNGETIEVDSRPSDAIAMALRFSSPIYVSDKVMEEAGIIIPDETQMEEQSEAQIEEELANITPLETLQRQLKRAIDEEKYEEAAKVRDQIQKLTRSN